MATSEQIKMLIQSHLRADQEKFLRIANEMADHESAQGRTELAGEIRSMVAQGRRASKTDYWVESFLNAAMGVAPAMGVAQVFGGYSLSVPLIVLVYLYWFCDWFLRRGRRWRLRHLGSQEARESPIT